MNKLNWDFRYVESRSKSGVHHSAYSTFVKADSYAETIRAPRRVGINPWVCVSIVLFCLWGLKVLVFG